LTTPKLAGIVSALSTVVMMSSSTLAATPASSDKPADNQDLALQEITVTANRVGAESLQKIPMAISAIAPADLDSKNLSGLSDFVGELPSVNMQSTSPGVNVISMRGLSTNVVNTSNLQNASLVGMYLDDASIAQEGLNPDLHVYDLERVEVLRGPQGTLYGAGSMAGTIRLITKKPDLNSFLGDADVSVSGTKGGGTNSSERGMINLPLVENRLAARLTLYRGNDSGYIDNIELQQHNANAAYSTQGRLVVRWLPIDTLTVDASATLARLNAVGINSVYPQLGDYKFASPAPQRFTDYFKLYNVTADWDLAFAHLISSSSYTLRDTVEQQSSPIIEALITPGANLPESARNESDFHDFQEELRLVSRPDQALRWIAGAYYERQSRNFVQPFDDPGFDAVFGERIGVPNFSSQAVYGTPAPDQPFFGIERTLEKQFALFGEATYSIFPKLDLTLGARYFHFKDSYFQSFTGVGGAIAPGVPNTGSGDQTASGVTPRAVLSYTVTDHVMVFGEASKGFRYGGVNSIVPPSLCAGALQAIGLTASPESFGPDHLWSFTLGEKATFADDRLQLNVDGFYINWNDVQTLHQLPCGYHFTQNAGKIRSRGVEWETKARVTKAFTVGISGSFTDATAAEAIPNLGARDGDRAPFFPRTIATATGAYDVPLAQGVVKLTADYTYRSNESTDFSPLKFDYAKIPSSVMLNASLGYVTDHWSLGIFGTNLTNNHLVSIVEVNTYGQYQPGNLEYWGRPRTIGVHGHVNF